MCAQIDLSAFDSIRRFTDELLSKHSKLDVLVNNAGMSGMPLPSGLTPITGDGFERVFQVNYLGPFYLTELLLPALRASTAPGGGRVINVASSASYLNCGMAGRAPDCLANELQWRV